MPPPKGWKPPGETKRFGSISVRAAKWPNSHAQIDRIGKRSIVRQSVISRSDTGTGFEATHFKYNRGAKMFSTMSKKETKHQSLRGAVSFAMGHVMNRRRKIGGGRLVGGGMIKVKAYTSMRKGKTMRVKAFSRKRGRRR